MNIKKGNVRREKDWFVETKFNRIEETVFLEIKLSRSILYIFNTDCFMVLI